jgi:hypothetical protein
MNIDKENLERLLLSHWTSFINPRRLLDFVQNSSQSKIDKISLSRFEFVDKGFLVWVEYYCDGDNHTTELLINSDGVIRRQTNA